MNISYCMKATAHHLFQIVYFCQERFMYIFPYLNLTKKSTMKSLGTQLIKLTSCCYNSLSFILQDHANKFHTDFSLEEKGITFLSTAPKVFTLAYALIKPFLHEVTLKKIKIFGHSGWKEALLQDINPDQLPQHWGGSRTDPDGNPKCPSQVGLYEPYPRKV